MRTILAIVIFAGGMLAVESTADAARKSKRSAKAHSSQQKVDVVCEERARHEDRAGQFKHFPCWAREAFGRGANINVD